MNTKPPDQRISPPRPYDIALYWRRHEPRLVDDLFSPRCFACQYFPYGDHRITNPRRGWKKRLERCHIVAHSIGGSYAPSNFMMLCATCHREAPMTSDPRVMITWAIEHPSCISMEFKELLQASKEAKLIEVAHLWRDTDRIDLQNFFRARRLDFHPQSTRLERYRVMAALARYYLETRQGEQGKLFEVVQ